MTRSKYFELLEEITTLTRGGIGKFRLADLVEMLHKRKDFVVRADTAFQEGELTREQYDKLIEINRKHALPSSDRSS